MIPAGWIPPKYREFIYEDLTEAEIEDAMSMMKISRGGGKLRPLTRAEFDEMAIRKIVGVRDTRNLGDSND